MNKLDKLLNSPWFVKIISLCLALLLYAVVNMDLPNANQDKGLFPASNDNSEVISNVPLKVYFDTEKYAVSNIPETVTLYLEGPNSVLTTTKLQGAYELYINLQGLKPGKHNVPIKYKGLSEKLTVSISPSTLTVNIHEKTNKMMSVDVELINSDRVKEGYSAEKPIILPEQVKVIGAKEIVERAAFVRGYIDINGADDTIEKKIPLKVYDQNGDRLDLTIEPAIVEVRVPVIAPNKRVPIVIDRKGELKDGLSIKSIEITPREVALFGDEKALESIETININLDLSTIIEDTTQKIALPLINGVRKTNPESVVVKIDVDKEEMVGIKDIPIKTIGLSNDLKLSFISPVNGKVNLEVFGAKSVLDKLKNDEFQVVVNVSEYVVGEQKVDLQVYGPQNTRWKLDTNQATVLIEKK